MSASQATGDRSNSLGEKIKRFLVLKNPTALRRLLAKSHFADIAEVMEVSLSEADALTCFQYLNIGQAAQVLTSLDEKLQEACLASLSGKMGGDILRLMAADDAVDILQDLDTAHSQKLLQEMPYDSDTRAIQNLMMEEPDTAAGIMSTDFIKISKDESTKNALALVRKAEEKDFVYYCYLVDENEGLCGVVSLKQLILIEEDRPLLELATLDVKSILTSYDQAFAANLFRKYYNLLAMPVVDELNTLRGIVTLDDIVEIIEDETSEELYRLSGIHLEKIDEKNLLTGPAMNAVKARMPWLSITVVGHLFASFIIASYETTVQVAVIAVSFMPLLTGLAGNMGTQSDTIAVRGISQGLITDENIKEKLFREFRVSLVIGLVFSVFVAFFSFFVYHDLNLTLLLAIWIVISLITTSFIGILIPYSYQKFMKQDPAGVGGPFITTLTDVITFSLYLYILTIYLDNFQN